MNETPTPRTDAALSECMSIPSPRIVAECQKLERELNDTLKSWQASLDERAKGILIECKLNKECNQLATQLAAAMKCVEALRDVVAEYDGRLDCLDSLMTESGKDVIGNCESAIAAFDNLKTS